MGHTVDLLTQAADRLDQLAAATSGTPWAPDVGTVRGIEGLHHRVIRPGADRWTVVALTGDALTADAATSATSEADAHWIAAASPALANGPAPQPTESQEHP